MKLFSHEIFESRFEFHKTRSLQLQKFCLSIVSFEWEWDTLLGRTNIDQPLSTIQLFHLSSPKMLQTEYIW